MSDYYVVEQSPIQPTPGMRAVSVANLARLIAPNITLARLWMSTKSWWDASLVHEYWGFRNTGNEGVYIVASLQHVHTILFSFDAAGPDGGCIFPPVLFSPRQTKAGYYDLRGKCYTLLLECWSSCGSQLLIAVSRSHNPGPDNYDGRGSDNEFRPSERNVIAKHPDRRHARLHIVAQGRQAKNKRHR